VVSKILYTPVGVGLGIGAGFVARKTFNKTWDKLDKSSGDGPPKAADQDSDMVKVVGAAALQALTFAVTKAIVDRQGRNVYYHLTGFWPGNPKPTAGDLKA
jgi:Protein of unknown function (DUF4235)